MTKNRAIKQLQLLRRTVSPIKQEAIDEAINALDRTDPQKVKDLQGKLEYDRYGNVIDIFLSGICPKCARKVDETSAICPNCEQVLIWEI